MRSKNTSNTLKLGESGPLHMRFVSSPLMQCMHVALYLLSKIQESHTFPIIDASFYTITFYHRLLFNVDPCSQVCKYNNSANCEKSVKLYTTNKQHVTVKNRGRAKRVCSVGCIGDRNL